MDAHLAIRGWVSGAHCQRFRTINTRVHIDTVIKVEAMVRGSDTCFDAFNKCISCCGINLIFFVTRATDEFSLNSGSLRLAAELPSVVTALCKALCLSTE